MIESWKSFVSLKRQRIVLLISLLGLSVTLFSFLHFLTYNENRTGFLFNDPILRLFEPVDVSMLTFLFTYLLAITGIGIALRSPWLLIKLVQGYTILTILRMISLYLVPLEPPVNIIPLQDVFLQGSFYSGRANLKDLFFSGHTATIFLFALIFTNKKLKGIYFFGAVAVGILVMLQHVHYSIDVIAAPVFAFIAFSVQCKISLWK